MTFLLSAKSGNEHIVQALITAGANVHSKVYVYNEMHTQMLSPQFKRLAESGR